MALRALMYALTAALELMTACTRQAVTSDAPATRCSRRVNTPILSAAPLLAVNTGTRRASQPQ